MFGAKPGGFGTTTTASGGLFGQQAGGGLFSKPAGNTGFGGFGQTVAAPAFGESCTRTYFLLLLKPPDYEVS